MTSNEAEIAARVAAHNVRELWGDIAAGVKTASEAIDHTQGLFDDLKVYDHVDLTLIDNLSASLKTAEAIVADALSKISRRS